MGRWLELFATSCACVACGSEPVWNAGPDAQDDATDENVPSFGDGAVVVDDAAFVDAPDVGLDDGGGPFMCGNCTCDGRTHYCYAVAEGAPIVGDASNCSSCIPLPDACVPANCDCLPMMTSCECHRASTGDGLIVACLLP